MRRPLILVLSLVGLVFLVGGCSFIPSLEPNQGIEGERVPSKKVVAKVKEGVVPPVLRSSRFGLAVSVPRGIDSQTFQRIMTEADRMTADQILAELRPTIETWKAQGLSREEINRKLDESAFQEEFDRKAATLYYQFLRQLFEEWERKNRR